VGEVVLVCPEMVDISLPKTRFLWGGSFHEGRILNQICEAANAGYLLFLTSVDEVVADSEALTSLMATAEKEGAGVTYSDFYDEGGHGRVLHPLIDCQLGSVRDDFEFGGMVLFSVDAIRKARKKYGEIPGVNYAGLYDLRLKVSIDHLVHHLPEPLYTVISSERPSGDENLFAYVDPGNSDVQKEMEVVFTDYLKRIGAYLPPTLLRHAGKSMDTFPVEASVIIPVRNRCGTIADAVESTISQDTDFPFNVIVVNNHSTDGTTTVLSDLAARYQALQHIVPRRTDLGIGGCWNEAINSSICGRFAVQLDSDDLYSSPGTLQRIIGMLRDEKYAMVIGSYTVVNKNMETIHPGLIDHGEWTDENGHNNALRINGLGAPRAFATNIIRKIGFLNVSYGEDYAAAMRICREYKIGRIYDSLYLCRRWEGNTDAALTMEESNRNDMFKDSLRTQEILERQKISKEVDT
jgi:hypothetical protein